MTTTEVRHPEPDLIVLWQRHLPERYLGHEDDRLFRVDALRNLVNQVERALVVDFVDEIDKGDIVLTISRRPSLYTHE